MKKTISCTSCISWLKLPQFYSVWARVSFFFQPGKTRKARKNTVFSLPLISKWAVVTQWEHALLRFYQVG